MKKLFLSLLMFQLFCVVSFAQTGKLAKAQTMSWIADSFRKYLNMNAGGRESHNSAASGDTQLKYHFIHYRNGIITLKDIEKNIGKPHHSTNNRTITVYSLQIYLARVKEINVTTDDISIKGPNLVCATGMSLQKNGKAEQPPRRKCQSEFPLLLTTTQTSKVNGNFQSTLINDIHTINFGAKPNLQAEIIKAFQTLIKYNRAEKN